MNFDRRRRRSLLAAIAVLAIVVVGAQVGEVFEDPELLSIDVRFRVRGDSEAPDDIVVLAIDDRTLDGLDQSWPYPSATHAEVLDRLVGSGAATVVYNVPFAADTDGSFADAIDGSVPVVLASTQRSGGTPQVLGGAGSIAAGAIAADSRYDPDDDGTLRRFDASVGGVVSLPVAAARASSAAVDVEFGDEGVTIDYHGPTGTFTHVSMIDLLTGEPAASLEGSIVVVGPTAASLQDLYETPLSERMSGTEVQANAISTLRRGVPLETAPFGMQLGWIVLVMLIPLAGVRLRNSARGVLVPAAVLAAHLIAVQVMFGRGLIVPAVAPVVGLVLVALAMVAVDFGFDVAERKRVREAFGRFVPDQVVRDVMEASDRGASPLNARASDVTVLFSDIRGFTTYAESRDPAEVITVLNDYLGRMTDVVIDGGGTLVNYMGDGVMAVFGAPAADDDHADRAFATALAMLETLEVYNADRRSSGDAGFRMGIGLHSGTVVAGNVGTVRRLMYTMIGDTVNTSARIEGMTKESPFDLLLSDETYDRLTVDRDALVEYATMPVRGRDATVRLWSTPAAASGASV